MALEISTYTIDGVELAAKYGADRVELCTNHHDGGITPSIGFVKSALEFNIDVYVIVRPRGGDFLYSEQEFKIMKQDIEAFKSLGVKGIVSGVLNSKGYVDLSRTKELIEAAKPMKFTFHRAFDVSRSWEKSLDDLIELGVDCILTSGMNSTAIKGAETLSKIILKAKNRVEILIGSGVNSDNIVELHHKTTARNFHLSAFKFIDSKMLFANNELAMGSNPKNENLTMIADEQKIIAAVKSYNSLQK